MQPGQFLDVLIVGAGISGISAACHLKRLCPQHRFAIAEARSELGGTWSLFRYPGIRCDSDMYTLGFGFRPWADRHSITGGDTILGYLRDTVHDEGLDSAVHYGHRMVRAAWHGGEQRWAVTLERAGGERFDVFCSFLFACCGYYRYERGYQPDFPGLDSFRGTLVHPQTWPQDLQVQGRRVVVIGSGATAVTLVPALADRGALVTMLQRSPTWLISLPGVDPLARLTRGWMPARWSHALVRWKNVLGALLLFYAARRRPQRMGKLLLGQVRRALPAGFDVERHFRPAYGPWEQRLCVVPDDEFFKPLADGRASIVTDHVERFTPGGLKLRSGTELAADIVVSATGLELQMLGGAELVVDGRPVPTQDLVNYKGVMYCGVPNFAATFGYTNQSWTLKADLVSRYVCRVLGHMRRSGSRVCMPAAPPGGGATAPWVDFSSGYFQRAAHLLPRQGTADPWKLHQNYLHDLRVLRFSRLDDGVLRFA
jgi:cation diffusion facilitator CzcD-associated flavoprotein CzcO